MKGSAELDSGLNIAAGSENTRYIILGMHEASETQRIFNNIIFSHFYYRNAFVQLNNKRYLGHDLNILYSLARGLLIILKKY